MLFFIDMILCVAALGFLCRLLFTLAVYALPFLAGLTAAVAAFHSGAGYIGAFVVVLLVGCLTLAIGQFAFASVRTPILRIAIALLYAVPAAIAGYDATLGLAQIGVPSAVWCEIFAVIGAVVVGGTAWVRMTLYVPAHDRGQISPEAQSKIAFNLTRSGVRTIDRPV